MNKKDIKNRNIEELMSLLLDKGILETIDKSCKNLTIDSISLFVFKPV